MAAEQAFFALPYDLRRKDIGGRSYLYQIDDRGGNGTSLGAWSRAREREFEAHRARKQDLKARRAASHQALDETARLCRALDVPMLPNEAGEILREADRRSLLDGTLLVIGTNAMAAYALETGGFIRDAPDETQVSISPGQPPRQMAVRHRYGPC